jgi:hypothetical protein
MSDEQVVEYDIIEKPRVSPDVPWDEAEPEVEGRRPGDRFIIVRRNKPAGGVFGFRWDAALMEVTTLPTLPASLVTVGFGFTRRGALRALRRWIKVGDRL